MSSERAGGSIAYCASKAGVDMLTKYMGQELGKYNIRVNSVNPAAAYTNIYVASGGYIHKKVMINGQKKKHHHIHQEELEMKKKIQHQQLSSYYQISHCGLQEQYIQLMEEKESSKGNNII